MWLHVDNVNVPLSLDRIRHLASHFPSVVFSFSRRDWLNSAERINAVLTELDSQLSWYAVNVPFSEGITENTSSRTDNIKTEDLLLTTQRLHDITWTASYRRMHNPDLAQARRIPLPATIYKGKVDVNFVMPLDLNAVELDNEQPISVAQPVFAAERFSPSPSPVHSYGRVVPDAHLLTTSAAYFRSSPVPTIPRVDSTASGHMLRVASTDDASQLGIMGTQSSDTPALWEQRPFFRLCHRSARHVSACRHIVFQLFPGIWTHHTSRATEFVREVQTFALHHPQLDRVIDAVTKDDDDGVVAVTLVPKMRFALPPQVWVRDFYLGHPTIFRLLRVEHDLGISPQVHYILHDLMSNGYTCCACGDAANGFETFPFRFDRDRGGLEWVRRTYMATNMAKRVFPNSALEFTLTLNSANCLADD